MSSTPNGEGVEDVKTVEGILKLKGNDELKFGLLIGLIELQQASNKDVVDTVLYLLVGGEFDIESNFVIQDPLNILHMLKLLGSCPNTLQVILTNCLADDSLFKHHVHIGMSGGLETSERQSFSKGPGCHDIWDN
ncbi:neurobeachin-like isoform X6 [Biomphalaria glabrata]|nr:neurobeachin-like isoform X6 [Biomphalaria glabrata]